MCSHSRVHSLTVIYDMDPMLGEYTHTYHAIITTIVLIVGQYIWHIHIVGV